MAYWQRMLEIYIRTHSRNKKEFKQKIDTSITLALRQVDPVSKKPYSIRCIARTLATAYNVSYSTAIRYIYRFQAQIKKPR